MKKHFLLLAVMSAIALVIGLATTIYWTQLRGIWPAISKPQQNIVQLIERSSQQPPAQEQTSEPPVGVPTTTRPAQQSKRQTVGPLQLPAGFSLSVFAKDLGAPRVLTFDPNGVLLASIPAEGKIVALIDKDKDSKSDETKTIIGGLNKPHGIVVQCTQPDTCKLYVAETDKLDAFVYDPNTLTTSGKRVIAPLPSGGNHTTRTILPHGDSFLVSVGSSCNVCMETDQNRAKILEIAKDTGKIETFATGLRNAVFMALHPLTGTIWATEMGRDYLGDNLPSDEINRIKKGGNYGWPICYGKNIHDTEFDKNVYVRNPCMEPFEIPSHIDIPAHSAPLGLAFIPDNWPAAYHNDLLVAYHGSWNRSVPTGYKIVHIKLDESGTYQGTDDFITGWLALNSSNELAQGGGALGRPVDILFAQNGTAYISDDKAGVIYKLTPPK